MLKIENLSHGFGKKTVLTNVNFSVGRGEIVGLIGPNGSGKTTLLNILMMMMKPTSGSFTFPKNCSMGMSVSRKGFFDDMSVINNIRLYANLKSGEDKKIKSTMEDFAIDYGDKMFGQLSAGMKQRVSLAIPFVDSDHLILLDEPSNHLDVDSILTLRNLILHRKSTGCAFLITSHIFSDLEKTTDRIVFLKNGNTVHDGATVDLLKKYKTLEDAYINLF